MPTGRAVPCARCEQPLKVTRSVGITSTHKKKAAGDQRPEFQRKRVQRTIQGGDPPDRKDSLNIRDLPCRKLALHKFQAGIVHQRNKSTTKFTPDS